MRVLSLSTARLCVLLIVLIAYASFAACVFIAGSNKERTLIKINFNPAQPRGSADARSAYSANANTPAPVFSTRHRLTVSRPPATLSPPPSLSNFAYENETLSAAEMAAAIAEHINEADDDPTRLPALWERLQGECYTSIIGHYEYAFCPFDNVTQRDTTGSLYVLLGVYSAWNVTEHGEYVMSFTDGTSCDHKARSVNVAIKCANTSREFALRVAEVLDETLEDDEEQYAYDMEEIIEASYYAEPFIHQVDEPRMCEYEMQYHTPLVCPLYRSVRRQLRRTRGIEYRIQAQTHQVVQFDRNREQRYQEMLACLHALEADNSTSALSYPPICEPFLQDDEAITTDSTTAEDSPNSPVESPQPATVNEVASEHQSEVIRHAGDDVSTTSDGHADDHQTDEADTLHSLDQVSVGDDNRILEARRSASTDRLSKRVEQRRLRHDGRMKQS